MALMSLFIVAVGTTFLGLLMCIAIDAYRDLRTLKRRFQESEVEIKEKERRVSEAESRVKVAEQALELAQWVEGVQDKPDPADLFADERMVLNRERRLFEESWGIDLPDEHPKKKSEGNH